MEQIKQTTKKFQRRKRKRGTMTKLDFFMLGFGSMVGVGWAVSSNHWLAQAGGPWPAFLGFLLGTILLIPIGLSYGELMSSLPVGGGVMVYTYRAFGTGISFLSSWFVALAYLTILPWEAIYINNILSAWLPFLGSGRILYHIGEEPIFLNSAVIGVFFGISLFWINYRGSKFAAKLQSFLSWVIIFCGILVIVFSAFHAKFANLFPLYQNVGVGTHSGFGTGILSMVVLVPFFMAGFDTIPQSVEEAHPRLKYRSIAWTLVLSIIAAGLFYALVILATGAVSPWTNYSLAQAPAMAHMLQHSYGGAIGSIIYIAVMLGTLAGLFSTWNGMFMASARLLQSMGRTGLLPKLFATEHTLYHTPVGGSIFCFIAAIAGPFIGMDFIDPLTSLGSVAFVMGWFLTCASALWIRCREPELKRPFKAPGGKGGLFLSLFISGGIVLLTFLPGQPAFMGKTSLLMFIGWLVLGGVFYYFTNYGERGLSERKRKEILFGLQIQHPCKKAENSDLEKNL